MSRCGHDRSALGLQMRSRGLAGFARVVRNERGSPEKTGSSAKNHRDPGGTPRVPVCHAVPCRVWSGGAPAVMPGGRRSRSSCPRRRRSSRCRPGCLRGCRRRGVRRWPRRWQGRFPGSGVSAGNWCRQRDRSPGTWASARGCGGSSAAWMSPAAGEAGCTHWTTCWRCRWPRAGRGRGTGRRRGVDRVGTGGAAAAAGRAAGPGRAGAPPGRDRGRPGPRQYRSGSVR